MFTKGGGDMITCSQIFDELFSTLENSGKWLDTERP